MNDNKTVKERYEAEPKTFALIYLDIIKERNRWRGITAFLAATSLLLTIGIVYAAFSVKYIPYIVSVSDSGEFKGVGVLNEIKYEPKEGDIISVRGKGRFLFEKVSGKTKKGRTGVSLLKYV